ncbi:histidyl-tRNA synthetase [Candidatus Zinderia insecticola CARI]|uniref:Histidine--tRNA ligase n=1 Tax=Zinderia insecticola (strain CARI) TaxID=871271 RepID=E0TIV8_ZINIC|nr:histidyl-tRNA synthetase [Candidatus Zinderia insecticola CARI]
MKINKLYIKKIKGTYDILPNNFKIINLIIKKIKFIINKYRLKQVDTPILEYTKLYKIILKKDKEITNNQIFSFKDKLNNNKLSLKPENTSGIIRLILENKLLIKNNYQKLWYFSNIFRHEKPQKWRYRQFFQLGIEIFKFNKFKSDIELLKISYDIFKKLKLISKIFLEINFIGNLKERYKYTKKLRYFFSKFILKFNKIELNKFYYNPLKILDNNFYTNKILKKIPKIFKYLKKKSLNKFKNIIRDLKIYQIPYKINPYLIRGLSYYNNLIFEWKIKKKSFISICGGGRYDYLFKNINKKIKAGGLSIGIERLILLFKKYNKNIFKFKLNIYIICINNKFKFYCYILSEILRNLNFKIILNFVNKKNINNLIKNSILFKSNFIIFIGKKEIYNSFITIKKLYYIKNNKKIYKINFNKIKYFFINKILNKK